MKTITVTCDFCGTRLKDEHPVGNIAVRDENNFAAADYDACNTCVSLVCVMLETRRSVSAEDAP